MNLISFSSNYFRRFSQAYNIPRREYLWGKSLCTGHSYMVIFSVGNPCWEKLKFPYTYRDSLRVNSFRAGIPYLAIFLLILSLYGVLQEVLAGKIILHRESLRGNLFGVRKPCWEMSFKKLIYIRAGIPCGELVPIRESLQVNWFCIGNPCTKLGLKKLRISSYWCRIRNPCNKLGLKVENFAYRESLHRNSLHTGNPSLCIN